MSATRTPCSACFATTSSRRTGGSRRSRQRTSDEYAVLAQDAARARGLRRGSDRRRDHLVGRAAGGVRPAAVLQAPLRRRRRSSSAPASRPACRSCTRTRARSAPIASSTRSPRTRSCKRGCIVVDFGTATTWDVVNAEGRVPGRRDRARHHRSAPRRCTSTPRSCRASSSRGPGKVVARNTVQSMQAGLVYGYAGMVDALVERIRAEVDFTARCIATGGLAPLIATETKTIEATDELLTLKGLKILYRAERVTRRWHEHTPLDVAPAVARRAEGARPGPGPHDGVARHGAAAAGRSGRGALPARDRRRPRDRATPRARPRRACPTSCSPARSPTPALDPRVLDFFAQLVGDKPARVRRARRRTRRPPTRRSRCSPRRGGAREVDRIAANEQRLLRHPEIIARDVHEQAGAHVDRRSRGRARGAQQRPRARPRRVGRDRARAAGAPATRRAEADALFAYAADALSGDDSALTDRRRRRRARGGAARSHRGRPGRKRCRSTSCRCPSKIRLATLGNAFARVAADPRPASRSSRSRRSSRPA